MNKLSMLLKIKHGIIDNSPGIMQLNDQRTKGSKLLRQLQITNDAYKFSFYPRTISDWNRLPAHITNIKSPQGFRDVLSNLHPHSTDVQPDQNVPVQIVLNGEIGWFYLLL